MQVKIPYTEYEKIMFFVDKSSVEISMMARVKHIGDVFEITKVYLLDQENSGTSTDIDASALAKLMYESRNDEGDLNCWIHSHVDMPVFWSGTDLATIKEIGTNGYLLALVFNKSKEYRAAYYQGSTSFLPSCFVDEINMEVTYPLTDTTAWEKEYEDKCRARGWGLMVTHDDFPSVGKVYNKHTGLFEDFTDEFTLHDVSTKLSDKQQAKQVIKEGRDDGDINPKCLHMRWGKKEDKWIHYNTFARTRDHYDSDNILDKDHKRGSAMRDFIAANGEAPTDDYELNEWYIGMEGLSHFDFYTLEQVMQ